MRHTQLGDTGDRDRRSKRERFLLRLYGCQIDQLTKETSASMTQRRDIRVSTGIDRAGR